MSMSVPLNIGPPPPQDMDFTADQFEFWDPRWFFPKYYKVLPKGGGHVVPFDLFEPQHLLATSVLMCYLDRKWLLHVKPRKEGSSTFFTGVIVQHILYQVGRQALILAQRDDVTRQLAMTANRFYKHLPEHMRPARKPGVKRTIEIDGLDTVLNVATVGQDDPARGFTGIHALLATEICKWGEKAGPEAWTSVLSNIQAPIEAPDGEGAFVVAESTPLHHKDELHKLWTNNDPNWRRVFQPWTAMSTYAAKPPPHWEPKPEFAAYAHEHGLSSAQAYWMQTVGLSKCNNDFARFRAEYPINELDCWRLAGESVFNVDRLSEMLRGLDGHTNITESPDEYQEFRAPDRHHRYVVAVDPAGSWSKRDMFAIEVVDLETCEQVAEFLGHADAHVMAKRIAELATRYNKATVYIESNGVGEAVLGQLKHLGYPRVYHRDSDSSSPAPGWHSNKRTKTEAVVATQALIDDGSVTIHSHRLLRQLADYKGQWDRLQRDTKGGHFDLVAAFCIAMWAWQNEAGSKNDHAKPNSRARMLAHWKRMTERLSSGGKRGHSSPFGEHR